MCSDDLNNFPASTSPGGGRENGEAHSVDCEPMDAVSQPSTLAVEGDTVDRDISGTAKVDFVNGDSAPVIASDVGRNMGGVSSNLLVNIEGGSSVISKKREGSPAGNSVSDVKKARIAVDEQKPSVHVMYSSLTRASKLKLEELLQQWSEWHSQNCCSSEESSEVLESGEKTYFPALRVGLDNPAAVSFWIDNQPRKKQHTEIGALEPTTVPMYDREYSFGLAVGEGSTNPDGHMEVGNASRCFNCGSYSHALKECPKPRDNAAVNNARNQLKSKRNHTASSRTPNRYYQNSPAGKYDGFKPGVLHAETRQLLGLQELDPPPWLHRMRELGYPPGYLDPEDDDQPSGILIFSDEASLGEKEDTATEGPLKKHTEPKKKMSVDFPGINAPIPENADEWRWKAAGPLSSDIPRNTPHHRFNQSPPEPLNRGHFQEPRWARGEEPPGCEPRFSPTLPSYSPRYGGYDTSYSYQRARDHFATATSSFERSLSEITGRSPSAAHQGSQNPELQYSSSYPPPADRAFSFQYSRSPNYADRRR